MFMLQSVCLRGLKKKEKLSFQDKGSSACVDFLQRQTQELGFAGTTLCADRHIFVCTYMYVCTYKHAKRRIWNKWLPMAGKCIAISNFKRSIKENK